MTNLTDEASIARRQFLQLLPAGLVVPSIAPAATCNPAVADQLDRMHANLVRLWEAERAAVAAHEAEIDRIRARPLKDQGHLQALDRVVMHAEMEMRGAYHALADMVFSAAGRDMTTTDSTAHRRGEPLAVARVGNRLFVVAGEHDADFGECTVKGFSTVVVIDL